MEETVPHGPAAMACIPKIPTHCGRWGFDENLGSNSSNNINSWLWLKTFDPHFGMVK
jgi:hypothetical protein